MRTTDYNLKYYNDNMNDINNGIIPHATTAGHPDWTNYCYDYDTTHELNVQHMQVNANG